MNGSVRLSKKHGLNPSMIQCFICGEAKGIAILGRLPEDKEAPRMICMDREPCDKCKEFMKQGIILVSVKDGEEGEDPYRTGGWVVVKEEALLKKINDPKLLEKRMMFVPDSAWKILGLPKH